jgi:hypothetical protein
MPCFDIISMMYNFCRFVLWALFKWLHVLVDTLRVLYSGTINAWYMAYLGVYKPEMLNRLGGVRNCIHRQLTYKGSNGHWRRMTCLNCHELLAKWKRPLMDRAAAVLAIEDGDDIVIDRLGDID